MGDACVPGKMCCKSVRWVLFSIPICFHLCTISLHLSLFRGSFSDKSSKTRREDVLFRMAIGNRERKNYLFFLKATGSCKVAFLWSEKVRERQLRLSTSDRLFGELSPIHTKDGQFLIWLLALVVCCDVVVRPAYFHHRRPFWRLLRIPPTLPVVASSTFPTDHCLCQYFSLSPPPSIISTYLSLKCLPPECILSQSNIYCRHWMTD